MQNLTNEEQVVVIQARTVLTLAEKVTVDALGGGPGPSLAQFRGGALLGRGGPQGLGWELAVGGAGSTKPGCSGGLGTHMGQTAPTMHVSPRPALPRFPQRPKSWWVC